MKLQNSDPNFKNFTKFKVAFIQAGLECFTDTWRCPMKSDIVHHLILLLFALLQAGVTRSSPVPGSRDIRETWQRP